MPKFGAYAELTTPADDDLLVIDDVSATETKKIKYQNLRPYKVYVALLTQSGTDDPTAIVLENSLGGAVVWTRNGTGNYTGTLAAAFAEDKTFFAFGAYAGASVVLGGSRTTADTILLCVADPFSQTGSDDALVNSSVEIRVYS